MVKSFGEFHDNLLSQEYNDGLNAETQKQIQTAKKMSDEEQKFSFLNNAFIYRKVRNSSDALFKKLVKMIEESSKKELAAKEATMPDDPAVETMDEEAGHLAIAAEEREAPLVPEKEPEVEPEVEEPLGTAALEEPVEEVPDANDLTNNADADADANLSEEQSGGAAKKRMNGRFAKTHPMKSTVVKRKK